MSHEQSQLLDFLGFLPMWSKDPNEKARMSHLFKWRWVKLERYSETDSFEREK